MGRYTKRFTEEQERAVLSIYFTNPFGDISFLWPSRDFGPEEIASENSRYSRSHLAYQERFLRKIEKEPNLDMSYIDAIVRDPSLINKTGLVGDLTKEAAHKFHTRWSLGYTEAEKDQAIRDFGDGSIRDAAIASYHVENIPDLDGKNITKNPKANPQVKSTRYLDWKLAQLSVDSESLGRDKPSIEKLIEAVENNPDVQASSYGEEIVRVSSILFWGYEELTDICSTFIEGNSLNREFKEFYLSDEAIQSDVEGWIRVEERKNPGFSPTSSDLEIKIKEFREKRDRTFPIYARKTVFDSTRYLLTSAIHTSLANSEDVNSLGVAVTNLLSSPMMSAQRIGKRLMEEGSKVMPTLLGEKTHISKSEYMISLRETLMEFAQQNFEFEKNMDYETGSRVTDLSEAIPMFTDLQLAVNLMFPYTYGSSEQIRDHFIENTGDIKTVRDVVKSLRGNFDPLPNQLLHGGLMKETLIDVGADRDLQRHRRGFHTPQLINTFSGYETPPLFELAGVKDRYAEFMLEADKTFRMIFKDNPFVAQLAVPFGFRRRRVYTWGFGQDGFVIELRSRLGAHWSYADAARDLFEIDRGKMSLFTDLIRVNEVTYPPDLINLSQARTWYEETKRGKDEDRSS